MQNARYNDLKNLSALFFVQVSNYILPLILIPILASRLGIASYGQLLIIQTIIVYANVITDYGFQFSATRKVAIHSKDTEYLKNIFVNVSLSKLILTLLSFLSFILITNLSDFNYIKNYIFIIMLIIFSNSFSFLWLFQGLQHLTLQSIILFASKIINLGLTIIFVRDNYDLENALLCLAISSVLPALFSLFLALKMTGGIGKVRWINVIQELNDGWPMFKTSIFSSLLTNSGVIILGMNSSTSVVGGYGAIEKIAKALSSMLNPLSLLFFPKMSIAFSESYCKGFNILLKFSKVMILSAIILAFVGIFLSNSNLINIIFGEGYDLYKSSLIALSPWIVLGSINNILGIQFLTNNGEQRFYSNAFAISSIISIAMYILFTKLYSFYALAYGLLFGEAMLLLILLHKSHKIHMKRSNKV